MGFTNFHQIDECIANYDDDHVSRLSWGSRQGQLTRFETMLLAGMGDQFLGRHPYGQEESYRNWWLPALQRLKDGGTKIGNYAPPRE
jgi:hypothetical protein